MKKICVQQNYFMDLRDCKLKGIVKICHFEWFTCLRISQAQSWQDVWF